ncbi:MAG TPA: ParB-like protein [Rhizomicrobium sp.]|nr:ParB-like protein [Rhizomicrobium sp.]
MTAIREPVLMPVALEDLRPTQITVGRREVEIKRKAWRDKSRKKEKEFLGRHLIPVVEGPKGRFYLIDHHHLALALHEEGVRDVQIVVFGDLSMVDEDLFWPTMSAHNWTHPFDDKGRRRDYKMIPKHLRDLIDDPYRSLAGELRRMGAFSKESEAFSEFQWADFLRRRVKRTVIEKEFTRALEMAMEFAKSKDAIYLPGWSGPDAE